MDKVSIFLASVAALGALSLADPGEVSAAPSQECYAHLQGKQTATTPAADRRYHLERGQPSPCSEQDANEKASPAPAQESKPTENKPSHDETPVIRDSGSKTSHSDDSKSRFCKKRFWC